MKNKDAVIAALMKEIRLSEKFNDEKIDTIYFGGGTPGLLPIADIEILLNVLRTNFSVAADAEITLEANPDDISGNILKKWLGIGINRLSVGIQTFDDEELRRMNRAHDAGKAQQCLIDISLAGFTNYSADLIYGSPGQTRGRLQEDVKILADHGVPHISCYALTVEEGTSLFQHIKSGSAESPDPAHQSDQFFFLLELLQARGYEQYEISNFSMLGYESRHNSSYWRGVAYYGFGPSAHSFDGDRKRKWNIANNSLYIQSLEKNIIPAEEELLTDAQKLNEFVMTSLRTSAGLDLGRVRKQFGTDDVARIEKLSEKFLRSGRLIRAADSLQLTSEGKFFADGIAAELFV